MRQWAVFGAACALLASISLASCGKPSAAPARDHGTESASTDEGRGRTAGGFSAGGRDYAEDKVDHRKDPPAMLDGKPMWAANRKHTAEENAQLRFEKYGEDFGAKDVKAYVLKARAFTEHPPAGAMTMNRPNGDKLIYDPKGNVFAVVTKDGAPRIMMKPKEGAAYWDTVKQREAQFEARYAARRERADRNADD